MCETGRDHQRIPGAQHHERALLAAEPRGHPTFIYAEHLVRGAVVVVRRVQPIAPRRGPLVRREPALERVGTGCGGLRRDTSIHERGIAAVGEATVVAKLMRFRRVHGCSVVLVQKQLHDSGLMSRGKRWLGGGLLGFSAWAVAACGGLAQESASTSEGGRRGNAPESGIAPQQPGSRGNSNGRRGPPPPVASSAPMVAPPSAPLPTLPPDDPAGLPPIRRPAAPNMPAEAECETGSTRCSGSNVEVCVATPGSVPEWFISQSCTCGCQSQFGLAVCRDEALCLLPECTLGAQRCTGDRLEVCAQDGRSWELLEQCATPCLCQLSAQLTGTCVSPRCAVGEAACDETGQLLTCNDCRSGFDVLACGSVAACDATQQRCLEADAGAPAP
jgi:hypothetical protein